MEKQVKDKIMIENSENDILFLIKKVRWSHRYDISVDVDNYVEIGDFFGISQRFL